MTEARIKRLALRKVKLDSEQGVHLGEASSIQPEIINHPPHYGGDTTYEVIKVLEAWGLEWDALLWNTVKYIARAGKKGDLLGNLKKAQFYLDRRIQSIERH